MTYTIETTKKNIEDAYGTQFEYIGLGMLAACIDSKPVVFRTNEETGKLFADDAKKLHEKQSENAGDKQ